MSFRANARNLLRDINDKKERMKDKAQFKQIDCMIQNKIYDLILATKDSVYIIITNNMYY